MRFPPGLGGFPAFALAIMLCGGRIDGPPAWATGAERRRKGWVIRELKERYGWPIESERITVPRDAGTTSKNAYFLKQEVIDATDCRSVDEFLAGVVAAGVIADARRGAMQVELNSGFAAGRDDGGADAATEL